MIRFLKLRKVTIRKKKMTKTTKKTGGATVDLPVMPDIAWFRAQVWMMMMMMMMMIGMNIILKVITT